MRVGVFVACAGRRDGGPETFEVGIVRGLAAIDRENDYRILCASPAAVETLALDQANFRTEVLWPGRRAVGLAVGLPASLVRRPTDVLHATVYPPLVSNVPCVFTMHDVTPFVFPGNYPLSFRAGLKFLVGHGLRHATRIVCVSEHARQTTAEYCKVDPARIAVVHHGIDPRFRPHPRADAQAAMQERYGVRSPYALYVGKLTAPKNLVRMLTAFSEHRREAPELSLVLCGRRFWDSTFLDEAIDRLDLRGSVIEPGYVSDDDLPLLYSGAEMVLYASLFEGFGFPLAEGMACGTPVITSNVASMPEIAGGAAVLVDPMRVDDIAAAIARVYRDSHLRRELSQKGLARAATFTWERAAAAYLSIYRDAVGR